MINWRWFNKIQLHCHANRCAIAGLRHAMTNRGLPLVELTARVAEESEEVRPMSAQSLLIFSWRAVIGLLAVSVVALPYGGCGAQEPETGPGDGRPPQTCPYEGETPFLDVEAFPECPDRACASLPAGARKAHCIPTVSVELLELPDEVLVQLLPCDDASSSRCVPDVFGAYMLTKLPKTCHSMRGPDGEPVEGRCMSRCLTQVAEMAAMLPKTSNGECDDTTELCAPCYDPRHGVPTPSCTVGTLPNGDTCDTPKEPPKVWERCCDNGGTCLPDEVVPEAQAATLTQKECPATYKCAPQVAVDNPKWKPLECRTAVFLSEGRCIPNCALDGFKNFILGRGEETDEFAICAEDEKCAPCKILGTDTGACNL
jgi:hypothetical protein